VNATALAVKKAVKATDRPVRVVPNNAPQLSSAQVLHNNMTDLPLGMELILISNGKTALLAQTVVVQDIDAYAGRDQKRPKRDARVGMLPPKLAQIIVNLTNPSPGDTLLDPFCGTGVVLQEAILMGLSARGTDIEPRMVEYTLANLKWLTEKLSIGSADYDAEVGDATTHKWPYKFTIVAAETYLGRPFADLPPPDKLHEVIAACEVIHRKFLQNLASQSPTGMRLCLAVPAWRTKSGFIHLKVLDFLDGFGYTRTSFVHAKREDLVYHREGQVVARELVTLIRK
jgi:tRNA (guanine10-N2)-dimethyltransferase